MNQNFKDSTRASIRKYVQTSIEEGVAAKKMSPEVLAAHSGVDLDRVCSILFSEEVPTVDEAFMLFTALGIPLDHLVDYVNKLPYFQRQVVRVGA